MSSLDKALLYRCLRTLFDAGVPFHQACAVVGPQLSSRELREALADISGRMDRGCNPARAMADHPRCFGVIDVSLMRLGMSTGALGGVLEQLALYYEASTRLFQRTVAALVYPLATFGLCLTMVVLGPPLLFQGLFSMLEQSRVPLPWITRMVIGFSELVRHPLTWLVLLSALAALVALKDRQGMALQLDRLTRRLYLLGPVVSLQALTRFARALGVSASAGLPVHEGIALAAGCSGSPVLQETLVQARETLLEGASLSTCLKRTGQFPTLFVMTLVAGEESGHYASSLQRVASLYELELECRVESVSASLGPVVTVMVGGVTGVLNLATLLPIMRFVERL